MKRMDMEPSPREKVSGQSRKNFLWTPEPLTQKHKDDDDLKIKDHIQKAPCVGVFHSYLAAVQG